MNLTISDPDPGRCRNFRMIGDEVSRCIEYESERHVCEFRQPTRGSIHHSANQTIYKNQQPKPWVKREAQQ